MKTPSLHITGIYRQDMTVMEFSDFASTVTVFASAKQPNKFLNNANPSNQQ